MVHHTTLGGGLAALRLNPEELPRDLLEAFVPRATEALDRRATACRKARIIAECANIHSGSHTG